MVGNALRDIEKLPERISKKELYELLAEVRNGNTEARETGYKYFLFNIRYYFPNFIINYCEG